MPARKRSPKDGFTATEVGTLIESLRNEIRLVVEGLADIRREVDGLKAWREVMTEDIALIKTELRAIRTDLTAFDTRLKIVEEKLGIH